MTFDRNNEYIIILRSFLMSDYYDREVIFQEQQVYLSSQNRRANRSWRAGERIVEDRAQDAALHAQGETCWI